jgi:hypothetical protein
VGLNPDLINSTNSVADFMFLRFLSKRNASYVVASMATGAAGS